MPFRITPTTIGRLFSPLFTPGSRELSPDCRTLPEVPADQDEKTSVQPHVAMRLKLRD